MQCNSHTATTNPARLAKTFKITADVRKRAALLEVLTGSLLSNHLV